MRRSRAFSLFELLVAVGVIAILVAILVPSLGRVRRAATTARCLVNMKQLAVAAISYGGDFNDCLPYPVGTRSAKPDEGALWFNAVDRYLSKTRYGDLERKTPAGQRCYTKWKECPVWEKFPDESTKPAENTTLTVKEYSRTIKMNTHLRRVNGDFARFTDIDKPQNHVLFGDGASVDVVEWPTNTSETVQFSMDVNEGGMAGVALRHGGGANIAFADGHASTEVHPSFVRSIGSKGVTVDSWQSEFVDSSGKQVRSGIEKSLTMEAQGFRRNPAMPLVWSQLGRLYGR